MIIYYISHVIIITQVVMILIHGSQPLVPAVAIGEAHQLVLGIIAMVMVISRILVQGPLGEVVVQEVELQDIGHTIVILNYILDNKIRLVVFVVYHKY